MRIMGLPVVAVLVATVVFFVWGGLWYGGLFHQLWMTGNRVIVADFAEQSQAWMFAGALISLVSVIGIATVLKWRGWPDLGAAIGTALVLGVCFGTTVWAYDLVYLPAHDMTFFVMNMAHLIIGWAISAIVLTMLR